MLAARFDNDVKSGHAIDISDKALKGWKEKDLDQVARELLYYLPFCSVNCPRAKKLQGRITLHRIVYRDIATAGKKELHEFASVMCLIRGQSFYSGAQWSTLCSALRIQAALSMDNVYSFPERFPQVANIANGRIRDLERVSANDLMDYVDGIKGIDLIHYARFLRKKIAYFQKKEGKRAPVTWFEAIQNWTAEGGRLPTLFPIEVRKLPYSALTQGIFEGDESSDLSFREYVYEQTTVAFERMLGASLPELLREDIKLRMKVERTRRDLVFYSAYPDQLRAGKPTGTPYACKYLDLVKDFWKLKERYLFDSRYDPLLLQWLFHWGMGKEMQRSLPPPDPKPSLDVAIETILSFSSQIMEPATFSHSAMDILLEVVKWPAENLRKDVQDIAMCCSWEFFEYSGDAFFAFLKNRHDLKIPKGYGEKLEEVLREMRAEGKSPLFLRALWNPLSEEQLSLAVELVEGMELEISAEQALKILLNLPNNRHYLETFPDEFSALTLNERLWFLTRKNPIFSKKGIEDQMEVVRSGEELLRDSISQGPFGKVLVLCKLVAQPEKGELIPSFISMMKRVQLFVGCHLEKDQGAKLFFHDLDLIEFERMLEVFIEERSALIEDLVKKNKKQIPKDSLLRIDEALAQFVRSSVSNYRKNDEVRILDRFNPLIQFAQSGIFCKRSEPLTSRIALGPHAGTDHYFVPVGNEKQQERMACVGWRMGESDCPIFDVNLFFAGNFRSSGFRVPFSVPLPKDSELFAYLAKLGNYHLAESIDPFEQEFPDRFKEFKPAIDEWIFKLKTHFRLAYLEIATRKPFSLGPKEGAFSLIRKEKHFTFLESHEGPEVGSFDLDQSIASALESDTPLQLPLSMHTDGSPVETEIKRESVKEAERWSVSAKGISLSVVFPIKWMKTPEQKKRALNWQISWLKALVFDLKETH